jgi:hypothetical protein
MYTLIALIGPFFSAILYPVSGGELALIQHTPTTPIILDVNDDPGCRLYLTSEESLTVADAIVDVVDNDSDGSTVPIASGGLVRVTNRDKGKVQLSAHRDDACRVLLLGSEDEPERAIGMFESAGS